MTPTLHHYTYAREEEGNKILRQYRRQHASHFIRVSFVNDDLDKAFYFNLTAEYLLGHIHSVLRNGIYAGRGLHLKFLSYSNSQLKNHTCWFVCSPLYFD